MQQQQHKAGGNYIAKSNEQPKSGEVESEEIYTENPPWFPDIGLPGFRVAKTRDELIADHTRIMAEIARLQKESASDA